jgi:hypothetical protein
MLVEAELWGEASSVEARRFIWCMVPPQGERNKIHRERTCPRSKYLHRDHQ